MINLVFSLRKGEIYMFVISKDTQDFINREGNNITIYLRALTPGEG